MSWLARLRSIAEPDARAAATSEALGRFSGLRVPLFLHERRLGDIFSQRAPNVTQLLSSGEVSVEVGGGYLGFAAAKASKTHTAGATIEITPFMQAILLEEVERHRDALVDLAAEPPRGVALVFYLGPGHIFPPWREVTGVDSPESPLDTESARTLQQARKAQERELGKREDRYETLVWVAQGTELLASITGMPAADTSLLWHYESQPPFGFLGMMESRLPPFTLLTPLVIWHDSEAATSEDPEVRDSPTS